MKGTSCTFKNIPAYCSFLMELCSYKGFRNADLQRNEIGQSTELTPLVAFLDILKSPGDLMQILIHYYIYI